MFLHLLRVSNQLIRGYLASSSLKVCPQDKTLVVPFRCWPIDIDQYMHMNNAKYLYCAELSRWYTFPSSGLMSQAFRDKKGLMFLVVENDVKYYQPINPMQKYIISTKVTVDAEDDKWLYYEHTFLEHPDDYASSKEDADSSSPPKKYAVVDMKAVMKQRNGKTIKPSEVIKQSQQLKDWITIK